MRPRGYSAMKVCFEQLARFGGESRSALFPRDSSLEQEGDNAFPKCQVCIQRGGVGPPRQRQNCARYSGHADCPDRSLCAGAGRYQR
jgi:hypothetical protein